MVTSEFILFLFLGSKKVCLQAASAEGKMAENALFVERERERERERMLVPSRRRAESARPRRRRLGDDGEDGERCGEQHGGSHAENGSGFLATAVGRRCMAQI